MVATLTGGERGDILNKAMDRPDVRDNLPGSAARRWPGPAKSSACTSNSSDSSIPGSLRVIRCRRCRTGCFALQPLEVAAAAAGARGPRIPAARDPDLRRIGRLPAPGSHQDPPGRGGGVRGRGGPGPIPRDRGTPGSRSSCTTSPRSTRTGSPRCTRRCCDVAWNRRTPSGSSAGRSAPQTGAWRSPAGCSAPSTSPSGSGAARARHPDRPEQLVVRLPGGGAARRLADRGLPSS